MFCGKCGQGLAEGATVCPNCGNTLPTTASVGAGRLKSTFNGGNATVNQEYHSTADVNTTQIYSTSMDQSSSPAETRYSSPVTPPAYDNRGDRYSGGGYSDGRLPTVGRTPSYGGSYSSGINASRLAGAKIMLAVVLVLCVFFLPVAAGKNTAGKDLIEPAFETLGNIFERLDVIFENLDSEYIMEAFLVGIFFSFGALLYVFSSIGVLIASFMNGRKTGKGFAAAGILGMAMFLLSLIIELDGVADVFDYLNYGVLINIVLYIAYSVVSGKE